MSGTGQRWLKLAPFATIALAVLMFVVAAANVALVMTLPASLPSYDSLSVSGVAPSVPFVATGAIALLLISRRPGNPVGWLLGALVVFFAYSGISQEYLYHSLYAPGLPRALLVPVVLTAAAAPVVPLFVQLLLVFPDGHLLSPRWRPVAWLNVGFAVASGMTAVIDPGVIGDGHRHFTNPLGRIFAPEVVSVVNNVPGLAAVAILAVVLTSMVLRYRRAGSELREQLKWFAIGAVLAAVGLSVASATATSSAWATPPPIIASTLGFSALPICIGIAVLKYRLYDIDIVINRALVYGFLAALITAVYVGIVVGIGSLIGSSGKPNLGLSIFATAIVAVGFQPVRDRLQKLGNRLVYGKRATPYEVLSEFSERVAETYAGEEVLPRMARILADGTAAERAAVWLRAGDQLRTAATWPQSGDGALTLPITGQLLPTIPDTDRAVPVLHQGELLGALSVSKRRGESLTPIEGKLLEDLAHQAGLVLKNVGLTADLQRRLEELRGSRQRLVAAQDQERRRLERNLHDGAQQNLVAIKVKLALAEMMTAKDPRKAKDLITDLKTDTDEALETLRDLAHGIYPPLLAEQGLAAALQSQSRKATVRVTVEGDGVGRYDQEVEAAVYFCVLEALQNVQKYAGASSAVVRLSETEGHVQFEVHDDGRGFDESSVVRGAGLTNMDDRMDALGGKLTITSEVGRFTDVCGRIPVAVAVIATT
jgi:signal transduction histidine kinase